MSISEIENVLRGRRSLIGLLVEVGGLAIAATGLIWIGSMRERVSLIEERLARIESRQVAKQALWSPE